MLSAQKQGNRYGQGEGQTATCCMQCGAEWQLIKCEVSVKAVRVREHVKESRIQRSRTAMTSACFQLRPSSLFFFFLTGPGAV